MKVNISAFLAFALAAGSCSTKAASVPDFVSACLSSSNLDETICQCSGDKAQQELSPKGFEFLVASLEKDEAKTSQLRTELSFPELTDAGLFMVNAPADCARELGGQ